MTRCHHPCKTQSRGKNLRRGSQINDVWIKCLEARQVFSLKADKTIRIILNNRDVVLACQLKKAQTPWHRHGDARRIVKDRNNVDELRLSALVCKLFELCLKQVCSDAFFVHINGVNSRLVCRKCLEIKRLLRTRSQNHLVRVSFNALSSQDLADGPSALNTTIRVAVLKRPETLNSNAASSALCNLIKSQRRNVW